MHSPAMQLRLQHAEQCTPARLPGVEHVLLQGAQAHAAGVLFPSDDDTLHRTILIANINPLINTEQVVTV